MASIKYSDVRRGMVIVGEGGQLFAVLDRDLKTPGNLPSKLTLKLKNLKTGFVNDTRVHPDDKVEQAFLDRREMQYIYKDGNDFVFMDTQDYDQPRIPAATVGNAANYLLEDQTAVVAFNDGTRKTVDLAPLLSGPVFEPLHDPAYFARVQLDPFCGTVVWPNGADLAPEALCALAAAEQPAPV